MVDPVFLSRLQFAFTVLVHILFPVVSMGLAPFLAYFIWKDYRTGDEVYRRLTDFWIKVFAVTFAVGTVSGIVLEFEFGMVFAEFSRAMGGVIGGPLAFEGMMAFMLESTFLGIFLFGRERISRFQHFVVGIVVAFGSWLSAFWILVVNSWMQTPRGYETVTRAGNRVFTVTDPMAAYLNPRFPWMFVHMQSAAVLTIALLLSGVSAYHLRKGYDNRFWRTCLKTSVVVFIFAAPFQFIHGDSYARHVISTQPRKFAAMEAVWKTQDYAPEYLIAFPRHLHEILNPRARHLVGIRVPDLGSILASGGDPAATIRGLNSFETNPPPVALVFWSFRLMIAIAGWLVLLAVWSAYKLVKGNLFEARRLQFFLMLSSVLGFVAVETGWFVAEVGRQPWMVYGVMKTYEGVSTNLGGMEIAATFVGFIVLYLCLLAVYFYVLYRMFLGLQESQTDGKEVGE
ncbi:MAG: cytochrome ubiquinol oxidase subunit I [Halobacteria archaeon]